jgi:hypothetical protein
LQNAKLLEELHLSAGEFDQTLEGLHDILSTSAGTLKVLGLSLALTESIDITMYGIFVNLPFVGLCKELEAMAGHNRLETLSLEVEVNRYEKADDIGSMFQSVERVLVQPGWSSLREVSFLVDNGEDSEFAEELQSLLPDKYLSHLSKLESVALNFSSYASK